MAVPLKLRGLVRLLCEDYEKMIRIDYCGRLYPYSRLTKQKTRRKMLYDAEKELRLVNIARSYST